MSNESFEKWWKTEPFGFDHPDTKSDIIGLIKEARKAAIEQCLEIVKASADKNDAIADIKNLIEEGE